MQRRHLYRSTLTIALAAFSLILAAPALADSRSITFETPTYVAGSVNGQDGWSATGTFDQRIVANTYGYASFGSQTFRISNAVTSGSFGDQTFSKSLADAAGEPTATANGYSGGTRQPHFEAQFDIASAQPGAQQAGLRMTVSPDRGDGSRASFLRFVDEPGGIAVQFVDVQGTSNPANFVETQVATGLDRTRPHTVKISMDFHPGPSNDVVKVFINGALVHTGTSWENYYRFDSEASAEQSVRTVDSLLFRASGTAVPATAGKGFLFDNLTLLSGPILVGPPTSKDQCKDNGWKQFNNPTFKNQGDCVSSVASGR